MHAILGRGCYCDCHHTGAQISEAEEQGDRITDFAACHM